MMRIENMRAVAIVFCRLRWPAPLSQPPSGSASFSFYAFVAFYVAAEKFISSGILCRRRGNRHESNRADRKSCHRDCERFLNREPLLLLRFASPFGPLKRRLKAPIYWPIKKCIQSNKALIKTTTLSESFNTCYTFYCYDNTVVI